MAPPLRLLGATSGPVDSVFFLKSPAVGRDLPWPRETKLVALDPGALRGTGKDPLTSTSFGRLHQSLRDAEGRVIPNLLKREGIAPGGRVAFVGFSAAHGFLNPLLANPADRAAIDSVLLMDACFGGGKRGFEAAIRDAADGRLLLVAVSTDNGPDVLTSGRKCFAPVVAASGVPEVEDQARPPAPRPSGGAVRLGDLGYWLRYDDRSHGAVGALTRPVMEAYLLPRFRGQMGRGSGPVRATPWVLPVLGAAAVAAWLWLR